MSFSLGSNSKIPPTRLRIAAGKLITLYAAHFTRQPYLFIVFYLARGQGKKYSLCKNHIKYDCCWVKWAAQRVINLPASIFKHVSGIRSQGKNSRVFTLIYTSPYVIFVIFYAKESKISLALKKFDTPNVNSTFGLYSYYSCY